MSVGSLTRIRRYPVKAMAGEDLPFADVEPWGIRGDRRWMLVDSDGKFLTAREHPRLLSVIPSLTDDGVRLDGRDGDGADVRVGHELIEVDVWRSTVKAMLAAETPRWLTDLVGVPARLVYLDDPTRREVDPDHGLPGDRVSFADGYPLLMTSTASLAGLNDWIAVGPHGTEGPLPMERFRPNVVVGGFEAWAEDEWRRVRIGDVWFRVAKPCGRCVVTTTDPASGARGREPLVSLAQHRNRNGKLLFGVNVIPEAPGIITVGDEVVVVR